MAGLLYLGASRPVFSPGPKTLVFTTPAGVAVGDLLMLVVAYDPADSYTAPGWTLASHLVGTEVVDVLVRSAELGDPATFTLALTLAATEWQGQMIAFRSGSPAVIVEASAIGNFAAATEADAPTVSTQQAINFELCAWSVAGAAAPVAPAGMTAVDGYSSALASSRSFAIAYQVANATGALPVRAAALNPATGSGVSLVLRDRPPVAPVVLYDPLGGNVGLRKDDYSNILLRLGEPDGVLPSDAVGNLDDLNAEAGVVAPSQVQAWTGFGRRFRQSAPNGLIAGDQESPLTGLHTVLQRDVTVQAILALTLAGAAGPQTIIARGTNDGSADERYCWGLEVEEQAAHPGFVEVRMFHQGADGTIHTQPAGVFQSPGDGSFFLLTATRRWESSSKVVTRYYVGGEQIAELTTTDGDIAGGTTGHTTLGGRKAAGAWGRYLNADLDELLVESVEMSAEEIRETHRRLAEHQPAGVEMFVGLMPPGAPWYDNPSNKIGRLTKIAGQALGQGIAEAERLRALWLPDAAPIYKIGDWERLCGLSPGPSDSLDVRRARVIGYLSRDNGFSIAQVQQALSDPLDLEPDQIQILEFSNTISDDFETLEPERWLVGDIGTWATAAGELEVTQAAGADLRWEPARAACYVRMPLSGVDGELTAQIKLSTYSGATIPVDTIVGLFLYNRRTNNAVWFGVKNVYPGTLQLGYCAFINGSLGAFVPIENPLPAAVPIWLRVSSLAAAPETLTFSYSTTGPTTGFTDTEVTLAANPGIEWVGAAAMSTDFALASNLQATFDDLLVRCPNGDRPYTWYAYRDSALPGAADMLGGDLIVRRIKPAHTYAAATASKSVLCDDPVNGKCDGGPMGAI